MDLFNLVGVTAVVTGSSRGIGLAIGRALLRQGARVVLNGVDVDETEYALAGLRSEFADEDVLAVAGDVTDPAVVRQLIEVAEERLGPLNHLVCNVGIDIIQPALDYDLDQWDRILRVNLRGAFQPAQEAARLWRSQGRQGSITMTSSIAGSVGIPLLASYAASKGGVNQLIRMLAAEWAPLGIRVNGIAPGYVDNIMDNVSAHEDPASDQRIRQFTPMARRGSLEEIAAPYAFLASPAAGYITGAVIAVDGGYSSI